MLGATKFGREFPQRDGWSTVGEPGDAWNKAKSPKAVILAAQWVRFRDTKLTPRSLLMWAQSAVPPYAAAKRVAACCVTDDNRLLLPPRFPDPPPSRRLHTLSGVRADNIHQHEQSESGALRAEHRDVRAVQSGRRVHDATRGAQGAGLRLHGLLAVPVRALPAQASPHYPPPLSSHTPLFSCSHVSPAVLVTLRPPDARRPTPFAPPRYLCAIGVLWWLGSALLLALHVIGKSPPPMTVRATENARHSHALAQPPRSSTLTTTPAFTPTRRSSSSTPRPT